MYYREEGGERKQGERPLESHLYAQLLSQCRGASCSKGSAGKRERKSSEVEDITSDLATYMLYPHTKCIFTAVTMNSQSFRYRPLDSRHGMFTLLWLCGEMLRSSSPSRSANGRAASRRVEALRSHFWATGLDAAHPRVSTRRSQVIREKCYRRVERRIAVPAGAMSRQISLGARQIYATLIVRVRQARTIDFSSPPRQAMTAAWSST